MTAIPTLAKAIVWPDVPLRRTYPKAPIFARVIAHFADVVIAFLPFVVAKFLLDVDLDFDSYFDPDVDFARASDEVAGALLLRGVFIWGIYYLFAKDGFSGGRSFGKRMLKLKVVNIATNLPCTKGESTLREVDLFLLLLLPIAGWLVEPMAAITSKDGRRLGDRVAGTQVIVAADYQPCPSSLISLAKVSRAKRHRTPPA